MRKTLMALMFAGSAASFTSCSPDVIAVQKASKGPMIADKIAATTSYDEAMGVYTAGTVHGDIIEGRTHIDSLSGGLLFSSTKIITLNKREREEAQAAKSDKNPSNDFVSLDPKFQFRSAIQDRSVFISGYKPQPEQFVRRHKVAFVR